MSSPNKYHECIDETSDEGVDAADIFAAELLRKFPKGGNSKIDSSRVETCRNKRRQVGSRDDNLLLSAFPE